MSRASVEELQAAEARLGRAFVIAVVAVICARGADLWLQSADDPTPLQWTIYALTQALFLGGYVWYATAIGRAATHLVASPWKYILWVLAVPFLALIPIPIVSTVIAVSPLSLKFFFSGQLRNEIYARSLAADGPE